MFKRGEHRTHWPALAPDQPVVHLHDVRKTFDIATAPVRALRGVDLDMQRGEFLALMGASGSGKSTLLSIIAGLQRHDDGQAVVAGLDLGSATSVQRSQLRRRHVSIVFQSFRLLEQMTALQNVAFAAQVAGARARAANERAADLLDQLGLLDAAADYPMTMSGGERQRLAIARSLAGRPEILLADEPTGSLDSSGTAEVLDLLRQVHAAGQTILLVTHDRSVAGAAQRTVQLRDGRLFALSKSAPSAPLQPASSSAASS